MRIATNDSRGTALGPLQVLLLLLFLSFSNRGVAQAAGAVSQAQVHSAAEAAAPSASRFFVGVNVSGLEEGSVLPGKVGVDYLVPTRAEFSYYHSKNLTTIRLPFAWERIESTPGGPLDPTYLGYIRNILGYAAAYGMHVIIDCHNYGRYNGVLIGAAGGPTQEQFARLWGRLAKTFAGTPGLAGYDIMNEPHGFTGKVWPDAAQAAIDAIRVSDRTTPIYVEGNGYSSAFQWITNGNGTLNALHDPINKLIVEAHAYGDYNNSGTYPKYPNPAAVGCTPGQTKYQCAQAMGDQLTTPKSQIDTNILVKRYIPFVLWCKTKQVACIIGESGVPNDDPHWLTALNKGISFLKLVNIPLLYWAAGPDFVHYQLGVEPHNGVDTVQMAVLTKFTGAPQPDVYYLTGPQVGSTGGASGIFMAQYYGYIVKPFTLTPSDGGRGGTFIPSSATCAPGFNCTRQFTYNAPDDCRASSMGGRFQCVARDLVQSGSERK